MTLARAAAAAIVLHALTGCPQLPPPAPRPHARIVRADREGVILTARLRVDDADRLRPVAVDWALGFGAHDLVRGRSNSLDIPMQLPPDMRPGALVRLRGAVHLAGPEGETFAPFDEVLRIP